MQRASRNQSNGRSFTRRINGENYVPNRDRARSRSRPKCVPRDVTDVELFDKSLQILPGSMFNFQNADDMENKIMITGGDGQMPELYKTFEQCGFCPEIMNNLHQKMLLKPTLIQRVIIPMIFQHNKKFHIMGHAPTGSGKTAAYMLPLINWAQKVREKHGGVTMPPGDLPCPLVIVVAPTKELAHQLFNDARAFALNTMVRIVKSYGDILMRDSIESLSRGCDIFIATCGRLRHFVEDELISLVRLRFMILDEADQLIKLPNFRTAVDVVLKNTNLSRRHRILMFSATFGEEEQKIADDILGKDHFFVRVGQLNTPVETVCQKFIKVGKFQKQDVLEDFILSDSTMKSRPGGEPYYETPRTIVFVNEKLSSDRLGIALCQQNVKAMSLNSDRTLHQRREAVDKFSHNLYHVLVSTDVAARGLNFPSVKTVINYDLPLSHDTYIHRIGRTGRVGNIGQALSYFDPASAADIKNAALYVKDLEESNLEVPDYLRAAAEAPPPTTDAHSPPSMAHKKKTLPMTSEENLYC